jgi:glutathione S-transferase
MHKTIGSLFHQINAEATAATKKKIDARLTYLETQLGKGDYLMGNQFTAADAYLFTVLRWTKPLEVDLTKFPAISAYVKRVGARPKVQEALKAEGIA